MKNQFRFFTQLSRSLGFTLVEIMVAMVILGVAVTSMYSVYIKMQQTTTKQQDVVDLQQNFRVSIDAMTRDIEMAGFLVPKETAAAIATGSDATTLVINMNSPFFVTARIDEKLEILPGSIDNAEHIFTVTEPRMTDFFKATHLVRIFRPMNSSQPYKPAASAPLGPELIVVGKSSATPSITLKNFVTSAGEVINFQAGDVIVRVGAGDPDPVTITWSFSGDEIRRNGQALANEIGALNFNYLLSNGMWKETPSTTELAEIVAIRITLDGTTPTVAGVTSPLRKFSSVAKIRNR